MILLTLETENYHFQAFGESKTVADNALQAALLYHAGQHSLVINWWKDYEISSIEISSGECFRDGQLLYRVS